MASAAQKSSRAMRGPLRCQAGTNAGAATAAGATGAGFTAAALWWVRRRFGSLCFSSSLKASAFGGSCRACDNAANTGKTIRKIATILCRSGKRQDGQKGTNNQKGPAHTKSLKVHTHE